MPLKSLCRLLNEYKHLFEPPFLIFILFIFYIHAIHFLAYTHQNFDLKNQDQIILFFIHLWIHRPIEEWTRLIHLPDYKIGKKKFSHTNCLYPRRLYNIINLVIFVKHRENVVRTCMRAGMIYRGCNRIIYLAVQWDCNSLVSRGTLSSKCSSPIFLNFFLAKWSVRKSFWSLPLCSTFKSDRSWTNSLAPD